MRSSILAVLLVVSAVPGCNRELTDDEKEFNMQMYLGETYFKGYKYPEAVRAYARAVEIKNDSYHANIGLGSAAREYSLTLYVEAERLYAIKKGSLGKKSVEDADSMTDAALRAFGRAEKLHPGDHVTTYNVALMHYKRATTPSQFPYPAGTAPPASIKGDEKLLKLWHDGVAKRVEERDEAIKKFSQCVSKEKYELDHAAHAKHCASPQSHRYLALLLLTRGKWELTETNPTSDTDVARRHLAAYLVWVQACREGIVNRPGHKQEDKDQKIKDLEYFDKELVEIKEGLLAWRQGILTLESMVRQNTPDCPVPVEKRPKRLEALQRELLIIEAMIRQFDVAREKKPGNG